MISCLFAKSAISQKNKNQQQLLNFKNQFKINIVNVKYMKKVKSKELKKLSQKQCLLQRKIKFKINITIKYEKIKIGNVCLIWWKIFIKLKICEFVFKWAITKFWFLQEKLQ